MSTDAMTNVNNKRKGMFPMKKILFLTLLAAGAAQAQISAFPDAAPLDGSEYVLLEQTEAFTKATVENLAAYSNTSGEFEATFSGFTTPVAATFRWARAGNLVTLRLTAIVTGTSNSSQMAATEIPVEIRPPANLNFMGVTVMNNGTVVPGCVRLDSAGTIRVGVEYLSGCNTSSFATSGVKQLRTEGDTTWTYTLN